MNTIMFKPTVFKNGAYAPEFIREDPTGGRFRAMTAGRERLFFDKKLRRVEDKVLLGTTFVAEVGEGCTFRLEDPYGGFFMTTPYGTVNISQLANLARPSARILKDEKETTDWSVFCRSNHMCDENRLVFNTDGYEVEMRFISHFEPDEDILKKPISGRRVAIAATDDRFTYVEFGFGVLIRLKEPNGTVWHLWTCPLDVGQEMISEDIKDAFGDSVDIEAGLSGFQSNARYRCEEELWSERDNILFPHVSLPSGRFDVAHGPARQLRADPENNYWDVFTEGCVLGKPVCGGSTNLIEFGSKCVWPFPDPSHPEHVSFRFVMAQPEFLGVVTYDIEEEKSTFVPKEQCRLEMFRDGLVCQQIRVRFDIFSWFPRNWKRAEISTALKDIRQ